MEYYSPATNYWTTVAIRNHFHYEKKLNWYCSQSSDIAVDSRESSFQDNPLPNPFRLFATDATIGVVVALTPVLGPNIILMCANVLTSFHMDL